MMTRLTFRSSAAVALVLLAGRALAIDILVTSTADFGDVSAGDGLCDADPGPAVVCTLRAAVQEANAWSGPDRIFVPGGIYRLTLSGTDEDVAATGDLDLTEGVQIIGYPSDRAIIDGNDEDRVFDLLGSPTQSYALVDLVIRNGSVSGNGGGVRTFVATFMVHCLILDNSAQGVGGGIFSINGDLLVVESLIEGNSAGAFGGGVFQQFGGLLFNGTIRGNHAEDFAGGLMVSSSAEDDVAFVIRSSIVGNSASTAAGIQADMPLSMVSTVVADNDGAFGVAGIRTSDDLYLTSSTIYGNRVQGENVAGIEVQGSKTTVALDHTILAGNTNQSGPADCAGPLDSRGYNLIGSSAGCSIAGPGTGDLLDVDPDLVGPVHRPLRSRAAGGRPAWLPRSAGSPIVDAGDPAGITVDDDFDPSTPEVPVTHDLWGQDRAAAGTGAGAPVSDIGAIESGVILIERFEGGDLCAWSSVSPGAACP